MTAITLDSKSPAVTFATMPCGTVIACEPDGSRILGAAHGDARVQATAQAEREASAFVRADYQRRNRERLNAAYPTVA